MRVACLIAAAVMLVSATQQCFASDGDCKSGNTPATYQPRPEDHADAKNLDASRSFAGANVLMLNVCQGDLRVRGTRSSSLRLEVTSEGADGNLSRYLHDFGVNGTTAMIDVRIPSKYHPVITVYVPEIEGLRSEINLGAGNLAFQGDRLPGSRKLNLGAGKAVISLDADRSYASLEANVGMGSFHDKRPGGTSAHFVIAKSMTGRGTGKLEVNVGAGEVDLQPAE